MKGWSRVFAGSIAFAATVWLGSLAAAAVAPGLEAAGPATPSPLPAASPSPSPLAPAGGGQWVVNGATVKLAGALAAEVDTGPNTFKGAAGATHGTWTARLAISGEGPITMDATVNGPGPNIDGEIDAFGFPITVHGSPSSNLEIGFGHRSGSSTRAIGEAVLAAAVVAPLAAAETPQQVAIRLATDWLRLVLAFTVAGWLTLLIAPALRSRARISTRRLALRRLGIGALLALDIPLACLVVLAAGLPLGLWWLGLLGLIGFVALSFIGYAYAGFQLARLVLDALGAEALGWWVAVPLGVGAIVLVGLIPTVGGVISLLVTVYGIGALLYAPRVEPARAVLPGEAESPRAGAELEPAPGRPMVE
jgi:hypothetical protein